MKKPNPEKTRTILTLYPIIIGAMSLLYGIIAGIVIRVKIGDNASSTSFISIGNTVLPLIIIGLGFIYCGIKNYLTLFPTQQNNTERKYEPYLPKVDGQHKYCIKCGNSIPAQAKYCPKCGQSTDSHSNSTQV